MFLKKIIIIVNQLREVVGQRETIVVCQSRIEETVFGRERSKARE